MSKKKVEPIVSAMGVLSSLISNLVEGVLRKGGKIEDLYRLIKPEGYETLEEVLVVIVNGAKKTTDYLERWRDFYKKRGIILDLTSFKIPPRPEKGKWWLIIIHPEMTYDKILEILKGKICEEGFIKKIDLTKEQRIAVKKPYAIWIKSNIEPDPDLKNISADDLGNQSGITLLERLILEDFYCYFIEDGDQLDVDNSTLCSGSRFMDGGVPGVRFGPNVNAIGISWIKSSVADSTFRSRQVISS